MFVFVLYVCDETEKKKKKNLGPFVVYILSHGLRNNHQQRASNEPQTSVEVAIATLERLCIQEHLTSVLKFAPPRQVHVAFCNVAPTPPVPRDEMAHRLTNGPFLENSSYKSPRFA